MRRFVLSALVLAALLPTACATRTPSPARLGYAIPESWSEDAEGAEADGLLTRLREENLCVEIAYLPYPRGEEVADPLNTVAVEYLAGLRGRDFTFELDRWRPWQIDPELVDVIGLHGRRSCPREEHSRMVFLDAGSGAYLVTMKSLDDARLLDASCDRFLESLVLSSR